MTLILNGVRVIDAEHGFSLFHGIPSLGISNSQVFESYAHYANTETDVDFWFRYLGFMRKTANTTPETVYKRIILSKFQIFCIYIAHRILTHKLEIFFEECRLPFENRKRTWSSWCNDKIHGPLSLYITPPFRDFIFSKIASGELSDELLQFDIYFKNIIDSMTFYQNSTYKTLELEILVENPFPTDTFISDETYKIKFENDMDARFEPLSESDFKRLNAFEQHWHRSKRPPNS